MVDPKKLKSDFPILRQQIHGKPLVYLDNAATTQKPQSVIDLEASYYTELNANIHRGIHTLSERATKAYEGVRTKIARFIGAASPENIIFTRGTTESINLVAHGWGRKFLKTGDEILLSAVEHHSNLIPWQMAAKATGAVLKFIPITVTGELDLSTIDTLLTKKTKLVAITAMSNVLGTIFPIAELTKKAHAVGALVLVDGAQSVPHLPTDVKTLGCDFLAFSAHKMLGPTGVGVLWAKTDILNAMDPFMGGGDMILEVWRERAEWNDLPWKFEAGTPNIGGVIAFGAALDYLSALGMDAVHAHEVQLTAYALDTLKKDKNVHFYGTPRAEQRGGVISFNYSTVHPHDMGTLLDQEGIAVRAGHHCCQPLMRDLDISGTVRASFSVYNDESDVDALAKALGKAATLFAGVKA